MTFGRTCTGVYSTENLAEVVDTFCGVLLPAAALRFYKSRSNVPHEIDFHKEQFLEMIEESGLYDDEKAELKQLIESSCDKVLSWAGCKNA
jgi:hypothetical protein